MAVVGGDVEEITWNNSDVGTGSGIWFPKSGEAFSYNAGGFRNEDEDEGLDGGGRTISTKVRKRWSLEGVISWDANITDELEIATQLSESSSETVFTIQHINGTVRTGVGQVVGDVIGDSKAATISIKISGGGRLKKATP